MSPCIECDAVGSDDDDEMEWGETERKGTERGVIGFDGELVECNKSPAKCEYWKIGGGGRHGNGCFWCRLH